METLRLVPAALQKPSTPTATAPRTSSATTIQYQNEGSTLSDEDLERLQDLPEGVKQLYTTGQLVLPGKVSRQQSLTLAPISALPETPEPQPPARHIQVQHPQTNPTLPASGIKQFATNIPPVRPHRPDCSPFCSLYFSLLPLFSSV